MKFRKISDDKTVVDYIAGILKRHLEKNERVLWLIPGGSAIKIAVAVSKKLDGVDLHNLAVTLTDERFVAIDHPNSNLFQLRMAGFDLPEATIVDVLCGEQRLATTERFGGLLKRVLGFADYSIGFFGIGADGHTAGILPESEALTSKDYAVSYDTDTYERITMTPKAIAELDEVVIYARGTEKIPALDMLATTVSPDKQPAQVLKSVKKLTIFNDYKGDER